MPTPRDWLAVSSKTAPSLFVAAARLLDYAQKSPGTGRLTTCAVTCHRHLAAQCYSHRHLHLENFPLLALLSSRWHFCCVARSCPKSQHPAHLKRPALRHQETSSSTGRPPTTARAETCATRRVMQPAWPRCGQPPLRNMLRRREIGPA